MGISLGISVGISVVISVGGIRVGSGVGKAVGGMLVGISVETFTGEFSVGRRGTAVGCTRTDVVAITGVWEAGMLVGSTLIAVEIVVGIPVVVFCGGRVLIATGWVPEGGLFFGVPLFPGVTF